LWNIPPHAQNWTSLVWDQIFVDGPNSGLIVGDPIGLTNFARVDFDPRGLSLCTVIWLNKTGL